jgi:predicted outer membrane repeat protein
MYSAAAFTMENSTVSGNEAKGGNGGGVYASGFGPGWLVEMRGVTVSSNKTTGAGGDGGGVYCSGALTVQDSIVSSNAASRHGGGILGASTLTIEDSTIKDNTAGSGGGAGIGGGIVSVASLSVNGSTISGNEAKGGHGGGICGTGDMALTNSTLSGNKVDGSGGGLFKAGGGLANVTLSNVTIAGNTADDDGSAAGDTGGGFYQTGAGTLTVRNSLIANNKTAASDNDCFRAAGTLTSQGYNLVENANGTCAYNAACPACFGHPVSNDVTSQDPKLAALADNGGPTWTQALQSSSPALDKILDGTNGCGISPLDVDQRGFARPRPTGDSCDMGAYETQSAIIYVPAVLRQ